MQEHLTGMILSGSLKRKRTHVSEGEVWSLPCSLPGREQAEASRGVGQGQARSASNPGGGAQGGPGGEGRVGPELAGTHSRWKRLLLLRLEDGSGTDLTVSPRPLPAPCWELPRPPPAPMLHHSDPQHTTASGSLPLPRVHPAAALFLQKLQGSRSHTPWHHWGHTGISRF